MLDSKIRPMIDPPLKSLAARVARTGLTANQITLIGFCVGLLGFAPLAFARYDLALPLIALNRLIDGLDGAVARHTKSESDFGAYLDIVTDFIFYGGAVFFFAVGRPEMALWAAFLIFSFVCSGSSFLAYAALAAKRGLSTDKQGQKQKGVVSMEGLAEETERIVFLILMCLLPAFFPLLAWVFGMMCLLTAFGRARHVKLTFST